MKDQSLKVFYGFLGILFSTVVGFVLLFWGFGQASERMNKRVRDDAFLSLMRQEVGWFDLRSAGAIGAQLADDAALLHAFSGEPIRTLVLNLASVLVGVVVAFVYMWCVSQIVLKAERSLHLLTSISLNIPQAVCSPHTGNHPIHGIWCRDGNEDV